MGKVINQVSDRSGGVAVKGAIPLARWLAAISSKELELWRECMDQLRQTHGDIWNGVRFYQTLNAVIIAAIVTVTTGALGTGTTTNGPTLDRGVLSALLAVLGLVISAVGVVVLDGHRTYYVDTLARKTLIEYELGMRNVSMRGWDLAFPWAIPDGGLEEALSLLAKPPDEWRNARRRVGGVTPALYLSYRVASGSFGTVIGFAVATEIGAGSLVAIAAGVIGFAIAFLVDLPAYIKSLPLGWT